MLSGSELRVGMALRLEGELYRVLSSSYQLPVEFFEGQPIGVVLPDILDAAVAETAPPSHSQGTDNVWKGAKLDNGVSIMVPPFIAPGERIRVDVQAGRYVERAKGARGR